VLIRRHAVHDAEHERADQCQAHRRQMAATQRRTQRQCCKHEISHPHVHDITGR
jgi:hypothetical protein